MGPSTIYLIALIINSVVLTCKGFNATTGVWWVSTLCLVAAHFAGKGIGF